MAFVLDYLLQVSPVNNPRKQKNYLPLEKRAEWTADKENKYLLEEGIVGPYEKLEFPKLVVPQMCHKPLCMACLHIQPG